MLDTPDLLLPPALPESARLGGLVEQLHGALLPHSPAPKDKPNAQLLARRLKARLPRAGVKVPVAHSDALRGAVNGCTDVSALLLRIAELADTTPDDIAQRVLKATPKAPPPPPRRKSVPLSDASSSDASTPARKDASKQRPKDAQRPPAVTDSTDRLAKSPATAATAGAGRAQRLNGRVPSNTISKARSVPLSDASSTDLLTPARKDAPKQGPVTDSTDRVSSDKAASTAAASKAGRAARVNGRVATSTSSKAATSKPAATAPVRRKSPAGDKSNAPGRRAPNSSFISSNGRIEGGGGGGSKRPKVVTRGEGSESADSGATGGSLSLVSVAESTAIGGAPKEGAHEMPGVGGRVQKAVAHIESSAASGGRADAVLQPHAHAMSATTTAPAMFPSPRAAAEAHPERTDLQTAQFRIISIMGTGKRHSIYARAVKNALAPAGFHLSAAHEAALRQEAGRCSDVGAFIVYAAQLLGRTPQEVGYAASMHIHEQHTRRAETPRAPGHRTPISPTDPRISLSAQFRGTLERRKAAAAVAAAPAKSAPSPKQPPSKVAPSPVVFERPREPPPQSRRALFARTQPPHRPVTDMLPPKAAPPPPPPPKDAIEPARDAPPPLAMRPDAKAKTPTSGRPSVASSRGAATPSRPSAATPSMQPADSPNSFLSEDTDAATDWEAVVSDSDLPEVEPPVPSPAPVRVRAQGNGDGAAAREGAWMQDDMRTPIRQAQGAAGSEEDDSFPLDESFGGQQKQGEEPDSAPQTPTSAAPGGMLSVDQLSDEGIEKVARLLTLPSEFTNVDDDDDVTPFMSPVSAAADDEAVRRAVDECKELAEQLQEMSKPMKRAQRRIRELECKVHHLEIASRGVSVPSVIFTLGVLFYIAMLQTFVSFQ